MKILSLYATDTRLRNSNFVNVVNHLGYCLLHAVTQPKFPATFQLIQFLPPFLPVEYSMHNKSDKNSYCEHLIPVDRTGLPPPSRSPHPHMHTIVQFFAVGKMLHANR